MKTNKFQISIYCILFFSILPIKAQYYGNSNYSLFRHAVGETTFESYSSANPASINPDQKDKASFATKPSRFGIKELNSHKLFFHSGFDSLNLIGTDLYFTGGNLYSEFSGEFQYARNFQNIITVGGSISINHVNVKNYNNYIFYSMNIGAVLKLSDDLKAGFVIRNLLGNHGINSDKNIYQETVAGLCCCFA